MALLRAFFTLLPLIAGDSTVEYFAVCDAGSTGTRLYVFALDVAAGKASSVFVKKTKPGLSSYANEPSKALAPLLALLKEGAQKVPEALRRKTPLLIFGTAGMRLLPPDTQAKIWSAVQSIQEDPSFPFDASSLQARTVSGEEEGLWAVLAANFLTGRMGHDLASHGAAAPLGLLDLGGSSTQIGIPNAAAAQKGVNFSDGVMVKSYLGFGMTHIREQVRAASDGSDASCYMKGTPVAEGVVGIGAGPACRSLIHQMMLKESETCKLDKKDACLGDLSQEASRAVQGSVDFFGVSGLTYVADFVHWWLAKAPNQRKVPFLEAYPRPTLKELELAVDLMCAGEYSWVEAQTKEKSTAHQYTAEDNMAFRCFQANYILVLLGEMYGFPKDARKVTYALEVEGEDLEWPLGALLQTRSVTPADLPVGEL